MRGKTRFALIGYNSNESLFTIIASKDLIPIPQVAVLIKAGGCTIDIYYYICLLKCLRLAAISFDLEYIIMERNYT